ncbi:MAG: hypothetical protein WBM34_02125 [Woeseiaceae bacterium]
MAPRPEFFRPVDAEGALFLDAPSGQSLKLVANGTSLHLDVPRWVDVRGLVPRSFRGRREAIRFFAKAFATHGLTLSLESAGKSVLRLGYNTTPSWLARVLGLAPAYVPFSALRLLVRR